VENTLLHSWFWRTITSKIAPLQKLAFFFRNYQISLADYITKPKDYEFSGKCLNKLNLNSSNTFSAPDFSENFRLLVDSQDTPKIDLGNNNKSSNHSLKTNKQKANKYPKISIVTPNYNQGEFLEKCIVSVLSQNYPNLEYIIMDGGSSDNSVEILTRYQDKITYWVSEEDAGQADAINKGLKLATGVIFNWLNSDDYLEHNALFRCAEAYRRNPHAAGWIGACRKIDANGETIGFAFPNGLDRENIGQNWNGQQFFQPSCFLSAEKVKSIGGLDSNLHIALDLDLWARVLKLGKFVAADGIWSTAIIHSGAKTQRLLARMFAETIEFQEKNGFQEGARIRSRTVFKGRRFSYVASKSLKERVQKLEHQLDVGTNEIKNAPTITFIERGISDISKDCIDFRSHSILKSLLNLGCQINCITTSNVSNPDKYMNSVNGNLSVYNVSDHYRDSEKIIGESKSDYVWISTSDNLTYLEQMAEMVERIRTKGILSKVVVDTTGYQDDWQFFNYRPNNEFDEFICKKNLLKIQNILYGLADITVTSCEKEKDDIEGRIGKENSVQIIPKSFEILGPGLPQYKRRNICFISEPDAHCSIDGTMNFVENIFSVILKMNPEIELHIIGSNSGLHAKQFKSSRVKSISTNKNFNRLLLNYRLCVFPTTNHSFTNYGFGIAAGTGLPIVSTSYGAEAYPVKDGDECFISDSPGEFGEKCNQCLRDQMAWHNFSVKLRLMVAENFSRHSISSRLRRVLVE